MIEASDTLSPLMHIMQQLGVTTASRSSAHPIPAGLLRMRKRRNDYMCLVKTCYPPVRECSYLDGPVLLVVLVFELFCQFGIDMSS